MEDRKYCSKCGKWIRPGTKDLNRRAYCSRECYITGSLIETNRLSTVRKRHVRAMPLPENDLPKCFYCGKKRECQRHHRNIANVKAMPVWACKPCHVADDMKRKKWGRGAAPRSDGMVY